MNIQANAKPATGADTRPRGGARPGIGPAVVLACHNHTDTSRNALAYAAGLAHRTGARLVSLTVAPIVTIGLDAIPVPPAPCADELTDDVCDILATSPDRCEIRVEVGDPASVIRAVADDLHADVIVLGRPHHPWRHPLGSVAGRLLRHAHQPVLIIP